MNRSLMLIALFGITLNAHDILAQESSAASPAIIYTGRLMGYFRWPDQQSMKQTGCRLTAETENPHENPNANASAFLGVVKPESSETRVLLGMGDNFAPELFSRTMDDLGDPQHPLRVLKDQYSWDPEKGWEYVGKLSDAANKDFAQGLGRIGSDNVACFFRKAAYDALVPGEYDFRFGPERLRQIARFLNEKTPDDKEFSAVPMLAANLTIETTIKNAPPRIPRWEAGVDYSDKAGDLSLSISDGDQVLPWLREITISGLKTGNDVFLCKELGPGKPDNFNVPIAGQAMPPKNCIPFPKLPAPPDKATFKLSAIESGIATRTTVLQPGTNYALCVTAAHPKAPSTYCARFSVLTPFFTYPDQILRPLANSTAWYPPPYRVKPIQGSEVAIFGVVDPNLNQNIGLLNYGWINTDSSGSKLQKRRSTVVKVMNPVIALRQTLEYFKEEYPHFNGTKILLAQMPLHEVTELSAQFKEEFQVVIAAGDLDRATGDQTVMYPDVSMKPVEKVWGGRPVVVVPRPAYDPSKDPRKNEVRLTLEVDELTLSHRNCPATPDKPGCRPEWSYTNRKINPLKLEEAVKVPLFECANAFDQDLSNALGVPLCNPRDKTTQQPFAKFQELTFLALRKRERADVVFLQKRDWFQTYLENPPGVADLQDVLDRVFFKGDFKTKTVITGRALKQVMSQSKAFDKEDRNEIGLPHMRNRGLTGLGIMFDPVTEQYRVNSATVADDQLYSVILSDFIGAGDTGYDALKTGAVDDPIHPVSGLELADISALVCTDLQTRVARYHNAPCRDVTKNPLKSEEYFDLSAIPPADTTSGFTATRHFLSWAAVWRIRPSLYANSSPAEKRMQNRSLWTLSVQKAEFGYDYKGNNKPDDDLIKRQFTGVSESGVANRKQTRTITYDWAVRTTRGAVFGASDGEYESNYVRGSNASITKNKLAFEGGVTPRIYPVLKETRALTALISLRWKTQLVDPTTTFKFGDGTISRRTGKNRDILAKLGLRFQNQKSWAEAGYEVGYHLKNEIDPAAGFTVQTKRKGEHGAFFNFHMEMPLPFRNALTYIMENTGDAFFNRGRSVDVPADTRFLERWSHAVAIPLVGNFSLVPKFEYFYFRNKVNKDSISAWQQTVTFKYNFDWKSGTPLLTALRYKNAGR